MSPIISMSHSISPETNQVFDVIAMIDSIMSQGVIESPEFTYEVSHEISFSMFLNIFKNFPLNDLSNCFSHFLI